MITKRKFLLGALAVLFTAFESLMFYLIHIAKLESEINLHYSCIIAAASFSWLVLFIRGITAKLEKQPTVDAIISKSGGILIAIAMLFTLWADYYLVAKIPEDFLSGVTVFLGTQLFIFLHIIANDKSKAARRANLITRVLLTICLVLVAYAILGNDADSIAIISVIYYANLLTNAIFAHRIGRGGFVLTLGLIFFALCDINVGLSGLELIYVGGFTKGSFLYNLVNSELDLVWFFYIPSQTLIPLTMLFSEKNQD